MSVSSSGKWLIWVELMSQGMTPIPQSQGGKELHLVGGKKVPKK